MRAWPWLALLALLQSAAAQVEPSVSISIADDTTPIEAGIQRLRPFVLDVTCGVAMQPGTAGLYHIRVEVPPSEDIEVEVEPSHRSILPSDCAGGQEPGHAYFHGNLTLRFLYPDDASHPYAGQPVAYAPATFMMTATPLSSYGAVGEGDEIAVGAVPGFWPRVTLRGSLAHQCGKEFAKEEHVPWSYVGLTSYSNGDSVATLTVSAPAGLDVSLPPEVLQPASVDEGGRTVATETCLRIEMEPEGQCAREKGKVTVTAQVRDATGRSSATHGASVDSFEVSDCLDREAPAGWVGALALPLALAAATRRRDKP